MDVFELTRALVDIDSVTPHEEQVGVYLFEHLSRMAHRTGGRVERMEVEPHRFNVLATWDQPVVTLSTHMDTVPPFYASRDDGEWIWGRGACDTKGIIASMIHAVEALLAEGMRGLALLFVVGEERNSAGAYVAAQQSRGSKYLINGEPTENKLAVKAAKERCGLKSPLKAVWRTLPTRIWANRRSRSYSMLWRAFARSSCPRIHCLASAH